MSVLHPICSFTIQNGLMFPLITWSQYVPNIRNISKFVIYRSNSGITKDEEYTMIGKTNANFYIDTSMELSRARPQGYKIGWEDINGVISSVADSEPVRWYQAYEQVTTTRAYEGFQDMMFWAHIEHIREMTWAQRNVGEDAWIYVKNIVGDLCPNYDLITKEHKTSRCDICWGVGYTPAYTIYKTQIPFQTVKDTIDTAEWGLKVSTTTNFRIGPYPWLKDQDLIRRQPGDLGVISDIQRDYWMTEQQGVWSILDKYVIEHEIPLDDAIDLTLPSLDQTATPVGWS